MSELSGKHIVIILEDMPAPFDTRTWQEALALMAAGAYVSMICPRTRDFPGRFETIDGIDIYRHPLPFEAEGLPGFVLEYGTALLLQLTLLIRIWCRRRIDVIHGCTPPDLIFLAALPFKVFGVQYLYDHHDSNPQLYALKFGRRGTVYRLLKFLERCSFRWADYSIAINQSYRQMALDSGYMSAERVQVVRSGPKLTRMKVGPGNSEHKRGRQFLVGYLGVISEQDSLDLLMEIIRRIVLQREDVQFAIVGGGPALESVKELASQLDILEYVTFYGWITQADFLLEILNTCDLCVNPDRFCEFNDSATAVKIMEYMAIKKPIVQFDLREARFSAAGCAYYAAHDDLDDFVNGINMLLDDEPLRESMGETGYRRVRQELAWEHEARKLVRFYKKILFPVRQSTKHEEQMYT